MRQHRRRRRRRLPGAAVGRRQGRSQPTRRKNLDVSAFTEQALEPDGTFLFPVTDHASEIIGHHEPVMQSIMLGQAKAADVLPAANEQVNALFK